MFFLRTATCLYAIKVLYAILHFHHIKYYAQGLMFHKINNFYCFIKGIHKWNWFKRCFLHCEFLAVMSITVTYKTMLPLPCFMSWFQQFYLQSLVYHRYSRCQHTGKGKSHLNSITKIVLRSQTLDTVL